ncbi:MAG TPA: FKBP-type peptidyl-prolyl cis-trans isomerase [Solirubrobacteraceae bacterium]|jgi:peptidylprolyl isomerase|nr:FKBP-type peptidyl-prolyl cis-trans isomerase [Solirubrobacteraceae bacterium]
MPAALLSALALLVAAVLIAGCGSSSESSTITVGAENKADNKLITEGDPQVPKTPTSGPLATKPTIEAGKGPKPTKLETKEIITGTGGEAKSGATVYVNYVGALWSNGKEFDSSWKRNEPFTFVLGANQVIKGWEQGVVGMKVGGRRELKIPSELAYGKEGNASIPKNEALIFVVDLLSLTKKGEG